MELSNRKSSSAWLLLFLLLGLSRAQLCPLQGGTPRDEMGPFYIENSPEKSFIGPAVQLQDPSNRLEVTGRVLSARNCSLGLPGVQVEIWYAGLESEVALYRDDEYRGQVVTDECGFYNFTQVFPALYTQRPILHTHFRLSRNEQEVLVTQMYFQGEEAGFVGPDDFVLQTVNLLTEVSGSRSAEFDIFVDWDGGVVCNKEGTGNEQDPTSSVGEPTPVSNQTGVPTSVPSGQKGTLQTTENPTSTSGTSLWQLRVTLSAGLAVSVAAYMFW